MTHYDTAASAGTFDQSRKSFESLITQLSGKDTAVISHAQLEELITGRGRELLRQLLQDHTVRIVCNIVHVLQYLWAAA